MNTSPTQEFAGEFTKLVSDVRHFIQQDMPPLREVLNDKLQDLTISKPLSFQSPALQTPSFQKAPPPKTEMPIEVLSTKVVPIKSTTYTPHVIKGDWELQAMPPAENSSPLRKKLSAYTAMQEPPLKVLLVLPEDNNPHRLFLENVSRAVTRTFASASVVLYFDGLLDTIQGKLLLAPLFLFQKRFPKALTHILLQEEGMNWIPLENLDIYAHDVTAKRALWMSIQRSFQS